MDRLTVDHTYDPATGFIVAREVIGLPPILANAPGIGEALQLAAADGRVVVAFATADRCAPCQQYKKSAINDERVIAALSESSLLATHIEVDRQPDVARAYLGSLAIPMTYAIFNGERIATLRGQRSAEELLEWIARIPSERLQHTLSHSTQQWHSARLDRLTADDGWLSLVGLEWLEDGPNRVGSDPDGDIVYSCFPGAHIATLNVRGSTVRIVPALGTALEGVPDDGVLRTDAQGPATVISVGGIGFHVIDRGGRLALRIKDANAPSRTGFSGIDRYPVDASWRIVTPFEPVLRPSKLGLATVVGVDVESEIFGHVRFERDGHEVNAVLFPSGDGGAYLRFADATNGNGTYAVGRYLSIDAPGPDGTVVLDFNRSYNPPCAFTPFATCTIPPAQNTFVFGVDAGERWDTH